MRRIEWAAARPGTCNETDEALFASYLAGEERALGVLIERYQPRITGFLGRRLDDTEVVEDLWANTLMRVFRARATFDPSRKFSTWIHSIANNLLKNEFRDRSRRPEVTFTDLRPGLSRDGSASRPLDLAVAPHNPERDVYGGEVRDALNRAVASLGVDQRTVFVMREYEDRTYDEIASATATELGTVKSRLNRARKAVCADIPTHMRP